VNAYAELIDQAEAAAIDVDYVLHASGSGGTQAGLAVGAKALGDKSKVLGVSVAEEKNTYTDYVLDIASDTLTALDLELDITVNDIIVFDEYLGEGYGELSKEVAEAIQLVSLKEGVFLDPVYTGKAMVALIDLVRNGYFRKDDNVVFFHTGGTAALFPNKNKLEKYLGKK
jgi:1-aminocyclopropane-1-carboxylate deaminase/D-cysteine desulfhydrase-like pyridoxal-dependent ACC family enzyme